jgi:hypothetical protein
VRGHFQAVQRGGLNEALHGLEKEFHGEDRVEVGAHLTRQLALLDEAAEDIGDVLLAHLDHQRVEIGSEALEVAEGAGVELGKALDHARGETAQFFGKPEVAVGEKGVGFGPDLAAELLDDRAHDLFLAGEVDVERLFAHAELGGEVVHGAGAVAVGEEVRAGLKQDARDYGVCSAGNGVRGRGRHRNLKKLLRYL